MECKSKEIKKERGLDFTWHEEQYEKLGIFSLRSTKLRGTRLIAKGLSWRKRIRFIQSSSVGQKLDNEWKLWESRFFISMTEFSRPGQKWNRLSHNLVICPSAWVLKEEFGGQQVQNTPSEITAWRKRVNNTAFKVSSVLGQINFKTGQQSQAQLTLSPDLRMQLL